MTTHVTSTAARLSGRSSVTAAHASSATAPSISNLAGSVADTCSSPSVKAKPPVSHVMAAAARKSVPHAASTRLANVRAARMAGAELHGQPAVAGANGPALGDPSVRDDERFRMQCDGGADVPGHTVTNGADGEFERVRRLEHEVLFAVPHERHVAEGRVNQQDARMRTFGGDRLVPEVDADARASRLADDASQQHR